MKNKILILALILTSFYACIVNNTSLVVINNNDLIGTWSVKNITMNNATLNVTSPVITALTANGFGKNFNTTITFSENPNLVEIQGDFIFELTYKAPTGIEKTEELRLNNIFFNDNFGFTSSTWTLADNELQLNEGGETIQIAIIDFVDNLLTIEVNVNQSITLNGVTSNVLGKASIKIQK